MTTVTITRKWHTTAEVAEMLVLGPGQGRQAGQGTAAVLRGRRVL